MRQDRPRGQFVDPRRASWVPIRTRGELPHLYKEGCTYFVTFRLWDAIAPSGKRKKAARVAGKGAGGTPAPRATKESVRQSLAVTELDASAIARAAEPTLRAGLCLSGRPECAELVQNALLQFEGQRYLLFSWCVMLNHVHVVFAPLHAWPPSVILHSWKSFTSHALNNLLGRKGALWERESFDHLIRSFEQLGAFVHCVENKPVEAGLCGNAAEWRYSSAYFAKRAGGAGLKEYQ